MVTPSVGSVVVVPFPFSDLSQSKRRPALILASAGREDWILCQITSKPYGDPQSIELIDNEFQSGSLRVVSYVRPGKLFTANASLLLSEIGVVKPDKLKHVIAVVVDILQSRLSASP